MTVLAWYPSPATDDVVDEDVVVEAPVVDVPPGVAEVVVPPGTLVVDPSSAAPHAPSNRARETSTKPAPIDLILLNRIIGPPVGCVRLWVLLYPVRATSMRGRSTLSQILDRKRRLPAGDRPDHLVCTDHPAEHVLDVPQGCLVCGAGH